jgi:hypothetical protein
MQLLLLRANKAEGADSTVDVLIRGVRWLQLPVSFRGLEIDLLGSWADSSSPHLAEIPLEDRALWRVRYQGGEGFVVGANLFAVETSQNWDEPSPLLEEYSINLF